MGNGDSRFRGEIKSSDTGFKHLCMMKHINNIRAAKKYSSVREDRIRAFLKITIKVNRPPM